MWGFRRFRRESGQALVLAAAAMVVILGMAAMAIDVGMFLQERRDLQNAADAAALAGAPDLPGSPANAVDHANSWAEQNGIGAGELEGVTVSTTYVTDDTITVQVKRDVPWLFARVLGRGSDTVRADATARIGSPSVAFGVMPWSLLESAKAAATYGVEVTLKYSAQEGGGGEFGLLDLGGGSGCNSYRDNVTEGSQVTLHSQIPIEPGNCVGPTEQGVEDRLAACSAECDTFEEVFTLVDGVWHFASDACNPWEPEGAASTRVVLVPVISDPDKGKEYVTVNSFAMVFLTNDATDNICPTGNACDVKAIYVKAYDDIGALMGALDPNSDVRFARLVE
jgi:hypothetical protein